HTARGEHQRELDARIETWTKTLDAKDVLSLLEEKGVPSGMIYSAKEIVEDPHYQAREMIIETEHPQLGKFPMPGVVPKLSRTPGQVQSVGAEELGQHNDEVYRELLGYDKAKLQSLKDQHVI